MVRLSIGRILCDFLTLTIIVITLILIGELAVPYRRGFYCDDESIRYPFKAQTVGGMGLIFAGLVIPMFLIFSAEVFRLVAWERNCQNLYRHYEFDFGLNIHRLIVRLYVFIGYFFIGACFNQLLVGIAKNTIGRHRPHFIDVCKPSVGYQYCPGLHQYIEDFTCTGTAHKVIHEAHLSFYSGHSSLSFYAACFLSLYLQARLYRPLISRIVLPVIQISIFGGATFVALTRISDYQHHWSDVLTGVIVGSILGVVNATVFANVFKRREIPDGSSRKYAYEMTSPSSSGGHQDIVIDSGNSNSLLD